MNIKEVKKHVYFNIAIYIAIFVCFIVSLIAILITPVKAQEQTTDITSSIRTNYDCPWGYNASGYCAIQTDNGGGVRAFNTRYNGVLNTIAFAFPYYFNSNGNTQQIIDIYSTTNDFRNNNINVSCYSYETSPSQSTVRNCSLRFISQKHIQVVYPYDSLQWHEIVLTSHNAITGVSNYLIQKVTLTYDDGQQDLTGIIDNATSNTTDIINNNNSNAETTQNVIMEMNEKIMGQIGNLCPNRANWPNGEQNKIVIEATHHDTVVETGQTINLTAGVKYYFSYERSCVGICETGQEAPYDVLLMYNSGYAYYINSQSRAFQFTPQYSGPYELRVDCNISGDICSYWNFYVGTVGHNYCPYGSYLSKLDDVNDNLGWIGTGLDALGYTEEEIKEIQEEMKDIQQDQYDYLTDDTDPNVPTSDIEDTLNLVEINNPLGYLLTLPLTLISKINQSLTASCTDFELGHFGFSGSGWSTPLKFPCLNPQEQLGSALWTTIDIIVAVGLLALTVYKIYQAVSNILTLGGEDEVSGSFVYWTPMEFLAIICGGTSVGVFQRRNKQ